MAFHMDFFLLLMTFFSPLFHKAQPCGMFSLFILLVASLSDAILTRSLTFGGQPPISSVISLRVVQRLRDYFFITKPFPQICPGLVFESSLWSS